MKLGEISLEWLYDADFGLDGGAMFGVVPKAVWQKRYAADDENFLPLALRPLLIRGPGFTLLVDAGYGSKLNEKQRKQFRLSRPSDPARALREAGLEPEAVTHLVFTHMHPDHAGGATCQGADGKIRPTFPNAKVVIQEREYEAMTRLHLRTKHAYYEENWRPIEEAGLLQRVDGTASVVPGVDVYLTGGHTLGHQAIKLTGGGTTLLHLGDLLPTHAHLNPLWVMAYDDFPMDSIGQKAEWLAQAQEEQWWLSFYHDAYLLAAIFDKDGNRLQAVEAPPRVQREQAPAIG
ncbi:MAG: MBL fold metallo-hydrolase [Candidatus Sericytochromatia bacterium]|uniref:MBL fold metallo-hydrolase n=1 Tax=Candidatus Tanganyikabacteria bacterium TaxID=2961651 RepID=A0A938BNJ3_9BACT|nr:MBL fold metallo-hydrolase [Candidatus Tanganyikabacteria bacterium]